MKYEVDFYDYENGATSPIDTIEIKDEANYTPEDYIKDCIENGCDEEMFSHGEVIFIAIMD